MKFGKILKIFKKGSKAASKRKGAQKGAGEFDWPAGVRIGVFGHTNAGKTVYFTVLNEECKVSRNLQLSVTDNATAAEFLANYRSIWGLGVSSEVGTVVDLKGEKKFPDPTQTERVLRFNAILEGDKKLPVVAYDYPGAAVSISDPSEFKDKVRDFMTGCDGLLFMFDPKVLSAELQTQAHVAAFVNMLEQLAPLSARLPIPAALVITKSDILDGFTDDAQAILIGPEDENLLSENFEYFLERILSSPAVSKNPAWSGSVRKVLVSLREFLKVVIGRTLDFQVFFVSSTGRPPEKIGTDVGRSLYRPPAKMSPIGVREPFYWLLNSITRNRSVSRVRTLAKYVAVISTIWCVAFSIPFLAHFMYLKPKATSVEDNILEPYKGNILNTTSDERAKVISAYSKYERSWMVRWLFPKWQSATMRAKSRFTNFDLSEEIKRLDQVTGRFTQIVNDSALWPQLNPADLTLIQNTEHETLLAGLNAFHQGDETSELYTRSDRVLQLWELFTAYITSKGDSTSYATIQEQVQFNRRTYDRDLSAAEKALGDALAARLQVQAEKKQQKEIAKKAAVELDTYVKKINKNDSPAYRLGDAVAELRQLRKQLDPSVDGSSIAAINDYIDAADTWKKTRKYTFKVQSVPGQGHLHIEVTPKGQDPTWGELSQIIEGYDYSVNWKVGDNIHLALDTLGAPEEWGKTASARKILTGNYSLFNMDGEISFDNLGLKVSIEFSPPLAERLPELEK